MKDVRNIVIGLLAVGLVWGWASGQQRRQQAPPAGAPGTYIVFEASIAGGVGRPDGGGLVMPFRMNTATGAIEMMFLNSDQGRVAVNYQPVPER